MKIIYVFLLVMASQTLFAQKTVLQTSQLELQPLSAKERGTFPLKMLCDPLTNPIEITFCEGEDRDMGLGDNNPANGAYMTWTAIGSNNLYYSRIYSGTDTFTIVQGGTSNSVYQPAADGSYTATLAIGGNTTNQCLSPGTWTVQVWDVMDVDGDLLPDRDANGNIIGCFTECTYTFLPSCPGGQPFDVEVNDIGCTTAGSIDVNNLNTNDVYCDGQAMFSWVGPNGFTSSNLNINNLDPGDYTFFLSDFYGCETMPVTVTVGFSAPVMASCGNPMAPSLFGASDGSFEVDITQGSGDYTIEWAGPVSGSRSGNDGLNIISGLEAGTYLVTITDEETGCTIDCQVTVDDPPCEVAFEVSIDNIGNITLTMTGGVADFLVSFSGTATASQDDLGPYQGPIISLSANLFDVGEYIFTVYEQDRPDCSAFEIFIIEGPDCTEFVATLEELNQPTCGLDNGNITISLAGGVNPTITWVSGPGATGSNDLSLTDLGAGTYSYQAIDEQGCVQENSHELTSTVAMVFDCGGVDETCPEANDGKLGLVISGGTGPYTLNYNAIDPDGNFLDAQTGISVTDGDSLFNLAPGDYFLQISDALGCSMECATIVEEFICPIIPGADQTVSLDSVINATIINGTGGVILSFTGTPDWTYQITSTTGGLDTIHTTSFTPDTLLGLPIDTYQLVLILPDNGGGTISSCCFPEGGAPITFVVEGPECDLGFIVNFQDPSCTGDSNGFIDVEVFGAIGTPSIFWEDGLGNDFTIAGLTAGIYSATVIDEADCSELVFVQLSDPEPIGVDLSIITPVQCGGELTAQIAASPFGAQAPISYSWSVPGAPDSPVLSGVPAGDYSVTIIDGNGCAAVDLITLTEPTLLDLSCGSVAETNIGTTDGKVGFTLVGGTTPYTFTLNGMAVSRPAMDTFTLLAPGEYTIVVTDDNGCMTSCVAVVNQGGCGDFALDVAVQQPDCESATGSAAATPVSPNGAVTYAWSHGPETDFVSGLAPGIYSVTATDAFTCQAVEQLTITAFTDFPELSVGEFTTVCDDDCSEVDLVLSGPEPMVVHFTIDQAGTQVQGSVDRSGGGSTLSLCPEDYGFLAWTSAMITFDSVVAGNGCSRSFGDVRSLMAFPPATGTTSPTICATDTFFLAGEAFHANRTTGDIVLPNASANGCDSTVSISLSFFAPALGSVSPTICATDTFFLAGEAFHADRTTGDVVLPNASANGCDSTVSVSLNFFAPALGSVSPTICATDTFFLAGEAFHADRTTGDIVLPNASANGCDSTVSISLSFFAPALGSVSPTICATDTFFLAGEAFHANRTTGDVLLANASANGCDSTVSINLNFFEPALGSASATICVGDTFFVAGEAFHAERTMGEVILPGASENGCDSLITASVTFFAPATAPLTPTICAADTFFLAGEAFHLERTEGDVVLAGATANGCDSIVSVSLGFFPQVFGALDTTICTGTSFAYGGRIFDSAVDDELVTLEFPSSNGCDSVVAVTVRLRDVPTVSISGEGVICDDGMLDISISYDGPAEATVSLSSNPEDLISLVAGTTTIQRPVPVGTMVTILSAEDGGPCTLLTEGSITVTESDLAVRIDVMSGDGVFAVSCAEGSDGAVMAIPEGGLGPFTYDWNTGDQDPMVEGLPAGDYSLIVTSGRGCTTAASISLNEPDIMVVEVSRIQATCLDSVPALMISNLAGGVGPYLYNSIDDVFRPVEALPVAVPARIGTTTFRIQDSNGCLLSQEFEFSPVPEGQIQVSPDQALIVRGDSVEITVLTDLDAAGFLLSPGPAELITMPDFFVSPDSTTLYTVTAVDSSGCSASENVLVVVDNFVPIYAPTAFSPNQDGNNDVFRIYGRQNVASFSDFNIFDRWGNRVYDFAGPVGPLDENWGWDGRASDGRLRQSAVYVFSVTVTFTDGRTQVVKGDLVLAR